jgi:hypothetical protein
MFNRPQLTLTDFNNKKLDDFSDVDAPPKARYQRSVMKCPTGRYMIVGSDIPLECAGTFTTEDEATVALAKCDLSH